MNVPVVDFHCHLDLYDAPALHVQNAISAGAYILSVTTTPKAWRGTLKLAQHATRIRTALGLHPQIAHERFAELELFDSLLGNTRYVGEVGLDGGSELKSGWKKQVLVFEHILSSVERAGGRILTVHSRRAHSAVLEMLGNFPNVGVPVLHWFTGTKAELLQAIDMGCWFSVGPAMLSSQRGREIVANIPKERVITETDGPFATIRGKKLMPGEVAPALKVLSQIWGVDVEGAAEFVLSSFRVLMSSKVGGPSVG